MASIPLCEGNAIYQQGTPRLDALMARYPHTQTGASGMDVVCLTARWVTARSATSTSARAAASSIRADPHHQDIQDGTFFEKAPLVHAMDTARETGKSHLMGLVSDGGVYSHNTHLYALLEMCKRRGVKNVRALLPD